MDNIRLFNMAVGKTLVEVNSGDEIDEELNMIMGMSIEEFIDWFKDKLSEQPKSLRKMKVGTMFDILANFDPDDFTEDGE